MTRSSLPTIYMSTSVPAKPHKGITREDHNITGTSKKEHTF